MYLQEINRPSQDLQESRSILVPSSWSVQRSTVINKKIILQERGLLQPILLCFVSKRKQALNLEVPRNNDQPFHGNHDNDSNLINLFFKIFKFFIFFHGCGWSNASFFSHSGSMRWCGKSKRKNEKRRREPSGCRPTRGVFDASN